MKRIAVLSHDAGEDHIWTYAHGELRCQDAELSSECLYSALEVAERLNLDQLWIHQSYVDNNGLLYVAPGWITQPSLADEPKPWYYCYRDSGGRPIQIALPYRDTRAAWHEADTGELLLKALICFGVALDNFAYVRSPGATGTRLLRALHTGDARHLQLEAPGLLPEPAQEPGLVRDFAWIRTLSAPELAHYKYLYVLDKNAMYLSACNGLPVGFGVASYHLAREEGSIPFNAALPGYWRVRLLAMPAGSSAAFPNLFDPAGRQEQFTLLDQGNAQEHGISIGWQTTPTLAMAAKHGALFDVDECYVWPEHHRVFDPWYTRMRNARHALTHADTVPSDLALRVVKQVYTQSFGWLDGRWNRTPERAENGQEADALYRPDWRHQVIAQAGAIFWHQALGVAQAGNPVVYAATDALGVLSNIEPGYMGAEWAGLRFGVEMGQWKAQHIVPLADVAGYFAPERMGSHIKRQAALRSLQRALNLRDESEEEDTANGTF